MNEKPEDDEKSVYKISGNRKIMEDISPFLMIGWQIVLTVVFMGALGWWLDKTFNTKPVLLVVLSLFGVVAALVHFLVVVMKKNNSSKQEKK